MTRGLALLVAVTAALISGLVATVYLATADARPPLPDALTPALEAERRVEHIYVVHVLSEGGEVRGPWICEEANVGTAPAVRRAGR